MTLHPQSKGLYIHVPFCARRCIYCDFYSTVSAQQYAEDFVRALISELHMKRGSTIHSVYFGGGTPSILSLTLLSRIIEQIYVDFSINSNYLKEIGIARTPEFTIEVNPDDVSRPMLRALRKMGFNRLSMGVQTFSDDRLHFLRRRHSSEEAERAVWMAREEGFDEVSIDLIYALPNETLQEWQSDVDNALRLPITHLSSYALIFEPGTPLYQLYQKGEIKETDDELQLAMFNNLISTCKEHYFEHYEISNFSIPGHEALHNTGYWRGWDYLGCGPGAHEYEGNLRRVNRPSLKDYVSHVGHPPVDIENLTLREQYEELILTRLRLAEGLCIDEIPPLYLNSFKRAAKPYLENGKLLLEDNHIRLSREAVFISDAIFADLI